jgi:ribosomal protein S17E
MSDFNDLVDDAENFADEENVDDYYPAEFSSAANNNKRANDDEVQLSSKRIKPPAHLADYFSETSESRQEKALNLEEKMKASENSYAQNNHGRSQPTNENLSGQSKGPNCLCGIGSVSKTTLKEGPNKNRMFWVRPV